MRRWLGLAGLITLLALVLFILTGTSLIPPSLWLGPCSYDWTSPLSYHPRPSPLGSVRFESGGVDGLLCYGRPAMRGRAIYGGLVPWHQLWRLGANEPTRLSIDHAAEVAGIALASGRYSLYVEPDSTNWTIYVTRSVRHWGNDISPAVRALEVGHASWPVHALDAPVEQFTASSRQSGDTTWLDFDWAITRFSIPVVAAQ